MQRLIVILLIFFAPSACHAQENVIDEIVAVIGNDIILKSDIEKTYFQYVMQGARSESFDMKCEILEELMFQKLLKYQAMLDSVDITDKQVEAELDRRMRYFVAQIGSEEALEKYFQKSVAEIKEELGENIYNQLMSETMQRKITENVHITPSEVSDFFRKIPKDSLPMVNSEIEIAQIVKAPVLTDVEKKEAKDKLENIKTQIVTPSDFKSKAVLYSQDPGSAKKGGDLGWVKRGELFTEVEEVAYGLQENEISPVFESKAGFHIVQMIERRGERINIRHILIKPQVSLSSMVSAERYLDSISTLVMTDKMTFEEAAKKFSDDDSKTNGGVLVNPNTGTSRFEMDQIDASLFFIIDKMKAGEISRPVLMETENGGQAYRLVRLVKRTDPHVANLKDDYPMIQDAALESKKEKNISDWILKKTFDTYVQIHEEYKACLFRYKWTKI
ncbi:MAG: peptidylprolyl isomerase [Bacteroidetes bacterium]|nr:peptidylprolyl isomerase [Bacteroidota bacterium]MBU1718314.1 peptidylprolyl isomerase [Bacteroidota bacterium]